MSTMYSYPYFYPYSYPMSPSYSYTSYMTRKSQDAWQQTCSAVLNEISRAAVMIDLCNRLLNESSNQQQLLDALKCKQKHIKQLSDVYIHLTGFPPAYPFNRMYFHDAQEGLQKAHEEFALKWKGNRYDCLTRYPQVNALFEQIYREEQKMAEQISLFKEETLQEVMDKGGSPYVVNIQEATKQNPNYRTAVWTGTHLQVTLMNIAVGGDIGLEIHPEVDQFIRIEEGCGLVQMGDQKDELDFERKVYPGYAIMIPAGKWHNLTNIGNTPMKLYSIYAPPEHPFGTIHQTKADALKAEKSYNG